MRRFGNGVTGRIRRTLSLALIAGIFAGCADRLPPTAPIQPVSVPIDAASMRAALAGPRVRVAVPQKMRDIGCAVIAKGEDGRFQAGLIPRGLVIGIIGPLDSIDAPLVRGRPTSGSLHVVSATAHLHGPARSYVINCLVPWSLSEAAFSLALAKTPEHSIWPGIEQRLRPYAAAASTPDVVVASEVLLAPIRSGAPPRLITPQRLHPTGVISAPSSPHFYGHAECGPGTDLACGEPTLPSVEVTARPGYPIVVDVSMLYRNRRIYSLSDLIGIYFYDGPDCSNGSATWLAMEETIQRMEAVAAEMEGAVNAVAHMTCEWELTDGGKNICYDLYIESERAAFLFQGDYREPDSGAPRTVSRAQLYINPELCVVDRYVDLTRMIKVGPLQRGPKGPHALNRVTATRTEGGCLIEWRLFNGYCGENALAEMACAPIDGYMILRSDGNGGWTGNVVEDKFPARGIYVWRGDHWETISERKQGAFYDLYGWVKHIEDLRIARDAAMPAGCGGIQ